MLGLGSRRLNIYLVFKFAASKHGLNGLLHLAAKISKVSFDRHCGILIFIGDNYPDVVIGMLFRLVHCDSRGDKSVDDGINKVIRIRGRPFDF